MFGDRFRQAFRLDEIEGRYDRVLFAAAAALASLGLVMVASSSIAVGEGLDVGPFYFLTRHVIFLVGGIALAFAMARIELKHVEKSSRLLLLLCFLLLALVFVPGIGKTVNGARRWLNLGFSGFQAVEAVKLMLIVWLASYLVRFREQVQSQWLGMLKPLGVAAGLVGVLLLQPDFGSAVLIVAITGGMVWLGGVKIRNLLAPALLAVPVLGYAAMSESYRVKRLTSFLDPWQDPFNDGFQLTQALIAIGRGEWFGVGLGGSIQKLFYLPEAHTDFIFAVISEELGFFGILVVLALFCVLVGRAFVLGLRAVELGRHFAGYCAFGVALWIGLQALVSIGVNLGVLPTKGLTLPLISSGGSSVLMTCAAVGLLLRVSFELDRAQRQVARVRTAVNAATLDAETAAAIDPIPPVIDPRANPRSRVEPAFAPAARESASQARTAARDAREALTPARARLEAAFGADARASVRGDERADGRDRARTDAGADTRGAAHTDARANGRGDSRTDARGDGRSEPRTNTSADGRSDARSSARGDARGRVEPTLGDFGPIPPGARA